MNTVSHLPWKPVVGASLQVQVLEIICELGARFKEQGLVPAANNLAEGPAAVAIACAQMDRCFPGEGWGDVARSHLLRALDRAVSRDQPLRLGLFDGLAGIAWSVLYVTRGGPDGRKILTRLDELLVRHVEALVEVPNNLEEEIPSPVYDIISGAAGISFYLLERAGEAGISTILERVYDFLIWLTVPPENERPNGEWLGVIKSSDWPRGVWNLGIAHGLPGVLAALAKGSLSGVRNPRLKEAVRSLADWLLAVGQYDEWGVVWPAFLPRTPGSPSQSLPARTAWCYGSPGVGRALWLAAAALEDAELGQTAVHIMETCCQRPRDTWRAATPLFCHGLSGVAHILLRFFHDTGSERFAEYATPLIRDICSAYEGNLAYGFRDEIGASSSGLLEGAGGVVLVLLAASTESMPEWDKAFGLS